MGWFNKKKSLVELKDYNDYPNSVYVDGVALKGQLREEAKIQDGFIVVRCITDNRLPSNLREVPGKVNCFKFSTRKDAEGIPITTFYFKQ